MVGETWWVWVAFGLTLAIMEVAIRTYVFLAVALAAILTGVVLALEAGPAGWMAVQPLNAVLACAGLAAVIWLGLRFGLGPPSRSEDD
ncbi:MAG: NfeD family protein [Alkalilacustris sp.]